MDKEFKPDYTPRQMFEMGIYGGCYFRDIYSSITKKDYKDVHKEFSFLKNINFIPNYDKNLNYYKVKSGQTLREWEKNGWIKEQDPYGWIQWYCRYHAGRRSPDDERQIKRWLGVKSRFGNREKMTDTIKQLLLQWGIKYTHCKKN